MRSFISLIAALACFLMIYGACGTRREAERPASSPSGDPFTTQPTPSDGAARISVEELQRALEKGDAVVVDVRGQVEYNAGHIKGARSIPLGIINQRAGELPRDKLIVTYCA